MATDNKYDRQLRLWGSEGQYLLNTSRVCCLGSTGLSSEILKNLVLPGIGFFTIVDDALVSEKDLGDNFFVTPEDLSKPRAEAVKSWLLELNPDVQGESIFRSMSETLADPAFFRQFTLVIASQVSFAQAREIGRICEENNIKLIVARSTGLLGYLRVYCKEHLVVYSKPSDKEIFDLRLHSPFGELTAYANGVEIEESKDIDHAHIPFVVLLLRYLEEWVRVNGHRPSNYQERTAFKEFIKSKSRNYFMEVNHEEAFTKAFLCFLEEPIPSEIQAILQDTKSTGATSASPDFWICARAVQEFIEKNGVPPLTGAFPDMTSNTVSYIEMQAIYKSKSDADYEEILKIFQRIKESTDEPSIVRDFCKGLYTLEVTRIRSISEEMQELNKEWIAEAEEDEGVENVLLDWYLALRALDNFQQANGRDPELGDLEALQKYTEGLYRPAADAILQEIIRFGSSEIHCISAVIGGVGSQEAVKLVTQQYTPINNTFIYNGVYCRAQVLSL